jgi:hypothetical protein
MWKEAVAGKFEVVPLYLPKGTAEETKEPFDSHCSTEVRTGYLQNTKQENIISEMLRREPCSSDTGVMSLFHLTTMGQLPCRHDCDDDIGHVETV